jgi:PAS domain S-box-containing protein
MRGEPIEHPRGHGRDLIRRTRPDDAALDRVIQSVAGHDRIRFQASLLDKVESAVIATDLEGVVVYWNRRAESLFGWPADEAVGRNVSDFLLTTADQATADEIMKNLAEGHRWEGEWLAPTKGGAVIPIYVIDSPIHDDNGKLIGIVGVSVDISEQKRIAEDRARLLAREQEARTAAEANASQLAAIQQITEVPLGRLSLDELLNDLLDRIHKVLDVAVSAVLLRDERADDLLVRAAVGLEEAVEQGLRIPVGRGISGRVARTKEPMIVDDLSTVDTATTLFEDNGIHSMAAAPLIMDGRVLGVLIVGSAEFRRFTPDDVALLGLVAERVAYTIDHARLLEAEKSARRGAEELAEGVSRLQAVTAALSEAATPSEVASVVIHQAVAGVGAAAGSLAVTTANENELEVVAAAGYPDEMLANWSRFPIDTPVPLAKAVQDKDLVLVESVDTLRRDFPALAGTTPGHEAFAALPLVVEGRVIGAIGLSFDRPRSFGVQDRALMITLAQQCAQALERARLYEAEQRAHGESEVAQESLAFLAEASQILASSLDYSKTLARIARLCVPRLADWVIIELPETSQFPEEYTVAHVDPAKVEFAREIRERYPIDANAPTGVPNVLRTGQSELYPHIDQSLLEMGAQDEEHLEILKSLNLRSLMIIPLLARGRTLGTITFVSSDSDHSYDEADLAMAEDLARRAALAIDNARLFNQINESRDRFAYLARTLQRSLLPPVVPDIGGMQVEVRYRPAAEGNQVGGDFYDLFSTSSDTWSIVVGDVCGKGARAAALTGLARHTIRAVALQNDDPNNILTTLNEAILRERDEEFSSQFCTLAYGRLQTNEGHASLTLACGGHPLPYVLKANGALERVGHPGMLLGVFEDAEVVTEEVALGPGDALILYTDGVTEARRGDEIFGDQRLQAVLRSCTRRDAAAIAETIERAVEEFATDGPTDDIAIVVLRLSPTGSPRS